MRLTVVGCAGSFPGPTSPASCALVTVSTPERSWNVAIDLGNGALGPLQTYLDPRDLDAVFITHLHPDHCADLTALYVTRQYDPRGPAAVPLPIYGPMGTGERVALMYHGLEPGTLDARFDFHRVRDGSVVRVGPLTITAFTMNHPVEAYGYRFSADGASIALTGDTDSCANLEPLMRDADLVLADCAFVEGRDSVRGIHLTGRRAAEAAVSAGGVRRLVLTHIPAWNDPEVCRAQAQEVWGPGVEVAKAGLVCVVGKESTQR